MADFRKWFLALSAGVAFFSLAPAASAQATDLSCKGTAGAPPLIRSEGLTELVGDFVLTCTGGTPITEGAVPLYNFRIFTQPNITSKILSTSSGASEATLLVGEPAEGSQILCPVGGTGCPAAGANVYQGLKIGENAIDFIGVPVNPPGSTGTLVVRITNVRVNPSSSGATSGVPGLLTYIPMIVSATGATTALPIEGNQQNVAYAVQGLVTEAGDVGDSTQCNPVSAPGALSTIVFKEGFASSFKRRNVAFGSPAGSGSPAPVNQAVPGTYYGTESGFYNADINPSAGLATFGTRLQARFTGIPAGVTLYASLTNTNTTSTAVARLTSTAGGVFSPVSSSTGDYAALTATDGTATAVWEVLYSEGGVSESLIFTIGAAYSGVPALTNPTPAQWHGSFAPISTAVLATTESVAPIPRFLDGDTTLRNLFTISPCSTNLLFPFLTNQAGFDSGIAIANTSTDPFGTTHQEGTCQLYFYDGSLVASPTTQVLPSGRTLTAVLSTGGTYGVPAVAGFQGYMIASCNFQYAHGFAFISDVGANRVSESYIALIMDAPKSTYRTGKVGESLGQ